MNMRLFALVSCLGVLWTACATTNYMKVNILSVTDVSVESFGSGAGGLLMWVTISNPTKDPVEVEVDCGRGRSTSVTVGPRSDERIRLGIGTGSNARKWN